MNAMRLALLALPLVAMLTACGGCPPEANGGDDAGPSSDWKPPTSPLRPPTGGLPDELRPPG